LQCGAVPTSSASSWLSSVSCVATSLEAICKLQRTFQIFIKDERVFRSCPASSTVFERTFTDH
jgi:hypothetical protein